MGPLGAEHPDTLGSMNDLALTRKAQGRDEEALRLIKECVRLGERVLGRSHPSFTSTSNTLADWEAEQRDIRKIDESREQEDTSARG